MSDKVRIIGMICGTLIMLAFVACNMVDQYFKHIPQIG